ncbi:hypothetical protein FPOAC2_04349 [Fusarium poae]|uniref:hypothetical protein n=1 Tax=Fusarium poae TaxID=36050 RepID=UPI001CEB3BD9|nr:hypothetical protein FPOAC1_004273 [Fusarium poae]KAG8671036.1 hypothetical protein FPOAC1_004273 [Fusarium poae]
MDESNIPAIAASTQLDVINLTQELHKEEGLSNSFEKQFHLQERYIKLLLRSIENHKIFGKIAQDYLEAQVIPNINYEDHEQRHICLSVGKIYNTLKVWHLATLWLRRAVKGFIKNGIEASHSEIAEVTKLYCEICEKDGRAGEAFAFKRILQDEIGYDPTQIPGDLKKAVEWCRLKGFDVSTEGDQLAFTHPRNCKGNSALHEAAREDERDTDVEILSKLTTDDLLSLKNTSGDTALLLAVDKSNTTVLRVLLNTPSLVYVRDEGGRTPLHRCRDHKTLRLILDGLNGSRHRPSITNADHGSHDATSSVIDINSQDRYGKTALFMACSQGKARMARELIDAGADVNAADRRGQCPLLACLSHNGISWALREQIILRLRSKGADLDQPDHDGNTARKELQRKKFHSSTKAVTRFLSLDPTVELEKLENQSRERKRDSDTTASTRKNRFSLRAVFS